MSETFSVNDCGRFVIALRQRAESYRSGGPSSEHTASMLEEAAFWIEDLNRKNSEFKERSPS